jgi:hypothetical protein
MNQRSSSLILVSAGDMQEHYVHAVPRLSSREQKSQSRRLVLVFREGQQMTATRDNGKVTTNLT